MKPRFLVVIAVALVFGAFFGLDLRQYLSLEWLRAQQSPLLNKYRIHQASPGR